MKKLWYLFTLQWGKLGKPSSFEQMRKIIIKSSTQVVASQKVHDKICSELRMLLLERDSLMKSLTAYLDAGKDASEIKANLSTIESELLEKSSYADHIRQNSIEYKRTMQKAQEAAAQIQNGMPSKEARKIVEEFNRK